MKQKFISILLLTFIVFSSFFILTTTVQAEEVANRTLIINSKVDPRVSAQKLSVTLIFYNTGTGDMQDVILNSFSDYKLMTKFPPGDYMLFSGMVSNDLTGYYIVSCDDFNTYAATTQITVTVGNPSYAGEVEEVEDFMVGAIDREKTNELREHHGYPPVDWDEVDKLIEEGFYELDSSKRNPTNTNEQETDDTDNPKEDSTPDETPTEETTIISGTAKPTTAPSTPDEIDEQENNKHKIFAIMFVLSVVVITGICIYYRNKNFKFDLDE